MMTNSKDNNRSWHWKRMVSFTEGESNPQKLVNDLKKMTDRLSFTLTEKIKINDTTEEEDRLEMFRSDLTKAFQLMLSDTGLDQVVKVPPPDVKYVAVNTEEISFDMDAPPPLPRTPPKPYRGRPSLAASDVSSSAMDDEDYNWLSPKSDGSNRKSHNDIQGGVNREFYFDLSHLDEE